MHLVSSPHYLQKQRICCLSVVVKLKKGNGRPNAERVLPKRGLTLENHSFSSIGLVWRGSVFSWSLNCISVAGSEEWLRLAPIGFKWTASLGFRVYSFSYNYILRTLNKDDPFRQFGFVHSEKILSHRDRKSLLSWEVLVGESSRSVDTYLHIVRF